MSRHHQKALASIVAVAVLLSVVSCGGKADGPRIESESHFLRYCSESCGDGLSCIQGVCTEGCVIGETDVCTNHAEASVCTNQSGEPGAVAVCDLPCDGDVDCESISESHACFEGYCRAPEAVEQNPSSASELDAALEAYPYVQPVDFPLGRDNLGCGIPGGLFDEEGSLSCQLVRVEPPQQGAGLPNCLAPGRAPVTPNLAMAVRAFMAGDACDDAEGDCLDWAMCEYLQLAPQEDDVCQYSTEPAVDMQTGFCGLDPFEVDEDGVLVDSPLGPIVEQQCGLGARAIRLTGDHTVEDSTISEFWMACFVDPQ